MKQTLKTLALTSALSLAVSLASAATAFTDPVGAMSITCLGLSDTYVSVPFAKAADFQGTLSGAPAGSGATRTLSITGSPTFAVNQFKDLWYVKFTSGPLNGRYYTVTANAVSTLTININGDTTVNSAVAGNSFKLIKYWTLAELFPSGQTTFAVAPDEFSATDSFLLVPDYSTNGIDLAASRTFFPGIGLGDSAFHWFDNSNFSEVDTFILPPDGSIIISHYQVASTTFVASGSVDTSAVSIPVFAQQSSLQDNFIGLPRPKSVALSSLFSDSTFVQGTDEFDQSGDTLFLYDNTIAGINKAAERSFIKANNTWYSTSDFSDQNAFVVPASAGLFIRKAASGVPGGSTSFIINQPNF